MFIAVDVPFALLGIAQWQITLIVVLAAVAAALLVAFTVVLVHSRKNKKKSKTENSQAQTESEQKENTVHDAQAPAPKTEVEQEVRADEPSENAEENDEQNAEENDETVDEQSAETATPAPEESATDDEAAAPIEREEKPIRTPNAVDDVKHNVGGGEKPAAVESVVSGGDKPAAKKENNAESVSQSAPKIDARYRKSYMARLIQSPDETKQFYSQLKNYALSFAGVSCRTTWNCESFNIGRRQLIKFNVRGKTLQVYFAIVPEDYEGTKYKVMRTDSKRYADVPCLYKIKNARRAKYALELIDETMEKSGIVSVEVHDEDFVMPYEPFEPLFARGLIKEIKRRSSAAPASYDPDDDDAYDDDDDEITVREEPEAEEAVEETTEEPEMQEPAEEAVEESETEEPVEEPVEETVEEAEVEEPEEETHEREQEIVDSRITESVTVDEAHEMISDEVASALVRVKVVRVDKNRGKAIVNIDTLSNSFEAGSVVTLSALKEKKLVGKNVGYVKVLARGRLDKPLDVELDDYSSDAVKMILLTGGKVKKIVRKK